MFTDVLKIVPKLDAGEMAKLERSLQGRFKRVAKSFGSGLLNVLKGGGIAGIGLALIDKVLNPLKETQDAIDKILHSSDDLATNAKQFNTTTGRLFKLVQIAKSTGLDQENLFTLINKFQGAIAQAKLNPNDQAVSSVKKFAIPQQPVLDKNGKPVPNSEKNQNDIVAMFFEFVQSLQSLKPDQQVLVQQQVFGEKQILKMADFLQTNFAEQVKKVGLDKVSTNKLTVDIEKLANLNDLSDVLAARRETNDVIKKAQVINQGMITARDQSEKIALQRENDRIASYQNLATISQTTEKIMGLVENGISLIGSFIAKVTPAIDNMVSYLKKLSDAPFMRGIKSLFGGKDDN